MLSSVSVSAKSPLDRRRRLLHPFPHGHLKMPMDCNRSKQVFFSSSLSPQQQKRRDDGLSSACRRNENDHPFVHFTSDAWTVDEFGYLLPYRGTLFLPNRFSGVFAFQEFLVFTFWKKRRRRVEKEENQFRSVSLPGRIPWSVGHRRENREAKVIVLQ